VGTRLSEQATGVVRVLAERAFQLRLVNERDVLVGTKESVLVLMDQREGGVMARAEDEEEPGQQADRNRLPWALT